jgi:hypothetical protein
VPLCQGVSYRSGVFYLVSGQGYIATFDTSGASLGVVARHDLQYENAPISEGLDCTQGEIRWLLDNGTGERRVHFYNVEGAGTARFSDRGQLWAGRRGPGGLTLAGQGPGSGVVFDDPATGAVLFLETQHLLRLFGRMNLIPDGTGTIFSVTGTDSNGNPRISPDFSIAADGLIRWGPGSGAARDTELSRVATGVLGGANLFLPRDGVSSDEAITTGEETLSRAHCNANTISLTTQQMRLCYFTARKTESVTQVRIPPGAVAAAATPTLIRVGVFSVAANGDLTLIASTPNDTTLLASTATASTKALSATWSKVAGTRYAVGLLVVSSATMPQINGATSFASTEQAIAPRMSGLVTGLSDLPSTVATASVANSSARPYFALLP